MARLQALQTDSHDSLLLEPTCLLKRSELGPWVQTHPSHTHTACNPPMTRLKQALSVGAWGGLFDCPSSNLICGFIHWTESGCENDWTDIIWPEIFSLSLCIFLHSFPSFPSSYTHTKTHLAFSPTMLTPPFPFLQGNRRRVLGHKLPQPVQPFYFKLQL